MSHQKPTGPSGPTPEAPDAVLRLAGAVLGQWREHSGMDRARFSELVGYGVDQVCSVELGRRAPSPSYLTAADDICAANGTIRVMDAHIRTRPRTQAVRGSEAASSALYYFAPTVLPDLFLAGPDVTVPDEAEHLAGDDPTEPVSRKEILNSGTPICLVLDEGVLKRVTERSAHAQQLRHLADLAGRPHIIVQVLTLDSGEPFHLAGPVALLREEARLMGFIDIGFGAYWLTPEAVREAEDRFAALRSMALPPRVSRDLILTTADQIEG